MFDNELKGLDIELNIICGIGRPTSTGRIERFSATYSLRAGGKVQYTVVPHSATMNSSGFSR
jgi:hypothetical protein